MPKFYHRVRNFILDLLFPIECLNCRKEGSYLCEKCFRLIRFNDLAASEKAKSNLNISKIDKIFIAGNYDDPILKNTIIKYKYNFISPLGKILGRFIITFWNFQSLDTNSITPAATSSFLVIPIPLSKERLRWRGFNQAEIIAREFSSYFNYELSQDLIRKKNNKPQATLDGAERLENIKSAFSWKGKNLAAYTIILIDDVVTTGATLNEAAQTLKEAGAKEVYALVLAKG